MRTVRGRSYGSIWRSYVGCHGQVPSSGCGLRSTLSKQMIYASVENICSLGCGLRRLPFAYAPDFTTLRTHLSQTRSAWIWHPPEGHGNPRRSAKFKKFSPAFVMFPGDWYREKRTHLSKKLSLLSASLLSLAPALILITRLFLSSQIL